MRRETRRSWDKSPDWGRPGTVFKTSQKMKGWFWECRRKGKRPSLVRVGREIQDKTRQDKDKTRHDKTRKKTRQDKTRQDKTQ